MLFLMCDLIYDLKLFIILAFEYSSFSTLFSPEAFIFEFGHLQCLHLVL